MPTLKDLLQTDYNSLLKMALSIDPINGQDYLHEAFGLNEIKAKLTTFQAILIDLVRNHKLTLLQISKETNIEYKVIYRNFKKIQKLCKDLGI
jgi:hypothetical protein